MTKTSSRSLVSPVRLVSRQVELPLAPSLERKWEAIGAELDYRVLAAGDGVNGAFHLARELPRSTGLRSSRRCRYGSRASYASSAPPPCSRRGRTTAAALSARRLARVDTAVIADLHGDWRAPTRLYGSRLRGLLNPLADRVALAALRKADGIRSGGPDTPPASSASSAWSRRTTPPPTWTSTRSCSRRRSRSPSYPAALFVGVLGAADVDGLAEAWRRAARTCRARRSRSSARARSGRSSSASSASFRRTCRWSERLSSAPSCRRRSTRRRSSSLPSRLGGPRSRL